MNYQQLDRIADLCNPILILVLIGLSISLLKNRAWPFLLRNGLAVVVVQQVSKLAQKSKIWGEDFPSTHFAVALALCVGLVALKRGLWPFALAYALGYGAFMLYIHHWFPTQYHTLPEMLGALFALPIALFFHVGNRKTPAPVD